MNILAGVAVAVLVDGSFVAIDEFAVVSLPDRRDRGLEANDSLSLPLGHLTAIAAVKLRSYQRSITDLSAS